MNIGFSEEFDIPSLEKRLREMADKKLLELGRDAKYMCSPRANLERPPREVFVIQFTVRANRRSYVLPRQIAMYLVRQVTGASLQEIEREFGGRHHTTVLHSINKIEATLSVDEAVSRTKTRPVDTVVARSHAGKCQRP